MRDRDNRLSRNDPLSSATHRYQSSARPHSYAFVFIVILAVAAFSAGSSTASGLKKPPVKPPKGLVRAGHLTFGTDFSFPPLEYIKDGRKVGFDPELGRLIAKQMGLIPSFRQSAFAAIIPSLQAHHYDAILSSLYVTAARAKVVDFVPYTEEGDVLLVPANGSFQPKQPVDLCGHSVAQVQGSHSIELMSPTGDTGKLCPSGKPITIHTFTTEPLAIIDVANGRSDAADVSNVTAPGLIKDHPNFHLKVSTKVFYGTPVAIAILKNKPQLKSALKKALAKLQRNGKLGALRKKYSLPPPDMAQFNAIIAGTG